MAFTNKLSFMIAAIVAQLMFFGTVRAEDLHYRDSLTEQESVITIERDQMTLVCSEPWLVEGEVLGVIVGYVYKDRTSQRPVDYWELYDRAGQLLAVSWFDKFGIERTAVDRGILEESENPEGLFVVLLNGETI
jgi:hypothetical protein